MSPLPSRVQAEALNLVAYPPTGACAGCGREPAVPGYLLGHRCRASLGLTMQPTLFAVAVAKRRACKWNDEKVAELESIAMLGSQVCAEHFGVSVKAVQRVAQRHGISLRSADTRGGRERSWYRS